MKFIIMLCGATIFSLAMWVTLILGAQRAWGGELRDQLFCDANLDGRATINEAIGCVNDLINDNYSTITRSTCPGDCDNDNEVTQFDVRTVRNIENSVQPLAACLNIDVDKNGTLDVSDYVAMGEAQEQGCP